MKKNNSLLIKLCSKKGETLTETLVAVLIAALALVMLAGAVSAAKSLIENSTTKLNHYYDNAEKMNSRVISSGGSYDVQGAVSISFSEQKDNSTDPDTISIQPQSIQCFENTEFSNRPVVAYVIKTS